MERYVLIEWRDPFESGDIREIFGRAAALAREGHQVTIVLVRDGVSAALRGEHTFWLAELGRLGVDVIADVASLRARDISPARISRWVRPSALPFPLESFTPGDGDEWLVDDAPALRAVS